MKRGVLVVDDDPFIRKLVATTLSLGATAKKPLGW